MKKILLTGSTSFLGSQFIQLYGDKYDIVGISRSDSAHPVDMTDPESLLNIYLETQPDIIIHTAAIVDQDANKVRVPNILGTQNIVKAALVNKTPIIFSSSESVYGGKEDVGEYLETDSYQPRSAYGETKVESEKIIIESGLNYLITRCHRYVGINRSYHKPKQFPDSLAALLNHQPIHLDSHKLFKPCLINHISEVYSHYIDHDADKKITINLGVDKTTAYYDFVVDVAKKLNLDLNLIKSDGEEKTWPENSTLSLVHAKNLGYPTLSYQQLLDTLQKDSSTL